MSIYHPYRGHPRIEADIENACNQRRLPARNDGASIEEILKGRDPRDAWAYVEKGFVAFVRTTRLLLFTYRRDALDITIPANAELVRNIMHCTLYMHDHVVHFYHLHAMDWVDVVNALKADLKNIRTGSRFSIGLKFAVISATSGAYRQL